MKSKISVFKLTYFKNNFRGQVIRALLNWAKVDWEDNKITEEDYVKMNVPYLPILEYRGQTFNESQPIAFYLAKKFKICGSDDEEEFQILSLQMHIDDINKLLLKILKPATEEEENSTNENLNYLSIEYLPALLKNIEKNYNGGSYYFGKKITLMDFLLGIYFNFLVFHPVRKGLLLPIMQEHAPKVTELIIKLVKEDFSDYYEKVHINNSVI